MWPPPMTMPISTPRSTTSRTSWAICCSVRGEMPYLPSPMSASPLSLSRMRLNRGDLGVGALTGGGSYLAPCGRSRRLVRPRRGLFRLLVCVVGEQARRIGRPRRARGDSHVGHRFQLGVHGGGLPAHLPPPPPHHPLQPPPPPPLPP